MHPSWLPSKNFNEELLCVAEEQHWQLGVHAQSPSTDSENEAKEHEVARPKTTTASVETANISWQPATLLRKAVFYIVPGTINVRRGEATHTPSITSSEEGEADIFEDMVDQLSAVPDIPIVGCQWVQFREPKQQASNPVVGGNIPKKIGMSYVELEPIIPAEATVYHPGPRTMPKLRKSQNVLKHSIPEVVEHSLQVVVQESKNIWEPKISKLKVAIQPMPPLCSTVG